MILSVLLSLVFLFCSVLKFMVLHCGRLDAVAAAVSEEQLEAAVSALNDCPEWLANSGLPTWFANTWLSEKQVSFHIQFFWSLCFKSY